jgi:uncharacterized membrane protein YphA (DoxX/SURF4 family)
MMPHLQRETPVSSQDSASIQWSQATKVGFRFLFSYFLLYIGPGAVGSMPSYRTPKEVESSFWGRIWHPIVPWVGEHILHIKGNFSEVPNGSGDQLYDYVLIFCMVLAAVAIAVLWSVLDRKRPNYRQLYLWLRLFMRLVVGWAMLGYGVKKLVGAQFPEPDLVRLIQPFGQASPMGMLWTFMGASWWYSFFGGFGETLGGVLMMIPRLATLGALVSGALITNVLMLNLCYDVPRKIFSIHLLLMCLFILAPDLRRLGNVLVLNRAAEPRREDPLFDDKQLNQIALIGQIAFGAYVLWVAGSQSVKDLKNFDSVSGPIHGVWKVDEYVEDGVVHPPLTTDSTRWQTIVFDNPELFTVVTMDGSRAQYPMALNETNGTATVWLSTNPTDKSRLNFQYPDNNHMTIQGQIRGHQVMTRMDRVDMSDPEKYPLVNKGFHWVNPYIDNR